jgi:PEP-CTERM motif
MKASRLWLGFAAVLAVIGLFTAPAAAHADTYQFLGLDSGYRIDGVGITASGTAVLVYNVPVGAPQCGISHICQEYETWVNGVMVNYSATAPNLVYDNGTPCTVSAPFLAYSVPGICNNGHEVYDAGSAAMLPYAYGTFYGPDPVENLLSLPPGTIDGVLLNSSGDFIFHANHPAGGYGYYEEAIDLTTDEAPEPASIVLLGTGLFAVAGTLRRRLF